MRRLHLFEIHDFAWCPKVFRDGLTDFLATSIARFDSYGPVRSRLLQAIQTSGSMRIVDLCSGGGGPWMAWSQTVADLPPVLLTDKFPNRKAIAERVGQGVEDYSESVDATSVPAQLSGFRTIFTAAHHFRPETVKRMIEDAVHKQQPIGIFELTHRSVRGIAYMSLSAIAVWLTTPMMKRITWSKLLFTYLLPVIPLMTSFDGFVSCLRTYTPEELAGKLARYPARRPARRFPLLTSLAFPRSALWKIVQPDLLIDSLKFVFGPNLETTEFGGRSNGRFERRGQASFRTVAAVVNGCAGLSPVGLGGGLE